MKGKNKRGSSFPCVNTGCQQHNGILVKVFRHTDTLCYSDFLKNKKNERKISKRLKHLLDKESKSLPILGDQCEETKVQSEVNPAPVQRCSWDLLFIFTSLPLHATLACRSVSAKSPLNPFGTLKCKRSQK